MEIEVEAGGSRSALATLGGLAEPTANLAADIDVVDLAEHPSVVSGLASFVAAYAAVFGDVSTNMTKAADFGIDGVTFFEDLDLALSTLYEA